MNLREYLEHNKIRSGECSVIDTSIKSGCGFAIYDEDVIWISVGSSGRWLSAGQAESLAQALIRIVDYQRKRLGS